MQRPGPLHACKLRNATCTKKSKIDFLHGDHGPNPSGRIRPADMGKGLIAKPPRSFAHGFRHFGNPCRKTFSTTDESAFAFLIGHRAGSLACRLTGCLAFAASRFFQILVQGGPAEGLDVFHSKTSITGKAFIQSVYYSSL